MNKLSTVAYNQLLTSNSSASIALASLSQIEEQVAGMGFTNDSLLVHQIAVGVELLAFDEVERQWADYNDVVEQYRLP